VPETWKLKGLENPVACILSGSKPALLRGSGAAAAEDIKDAPTVPQKKGIYGRL
jgi:hypothetical protein